MGTLVAVVAALAIPAAANAAVICVPTMTFDGSCTVQNATVDGALNDAQATTTVADTVLIDSGTFTEDDMNYATADPDNDLDVIGRGAGVTTVQRATTTGTVDGLFLDGGNAASVEVFNLSVNMPPNADTMTDTGIRLTGGASAEGVRVESTMTSNARGIEPDDGTVVHDSTVSLPLGTGTTAVKSIGGNKTISDSELTADVGAEHGANTGETLTIERSLIRADQLGMSTDSASLALRDSVIDLGSSPNGIGVQVANFNMSDGTMAATVEGSTIVGGTGSAIGVYVQADVDMETATGTLSNTAIEGPPTPLAVFADDGRTATLNASYSNYNVGGVVDNDNMGAGTTNTMFSNISTHFPAGFAADGYHLLPTSPLLDIGDPAAPMMGATDVEGDARALDATPSCNGVGNVARRDIGADELVATIPTCPPPGGGPGITPPVVTPPVTSATPPAAKKKCKKGRKLRRGRCVRKKKKK